MKNNAKLEQPRINEMCACQFELAMNEAIEKTSIVGYEWKKFRNCSANVLKLDDYVLLCSYRTIVACVNLNTHEGFDLLRREYGYTATSAQHIAKFFNDYNAKERYRWQYIA